MPYLPPDSGNLEPEIRCALIFFPDAEEYQRALFGQIAELSDVWNWEADAATQAIIRSVWLAAEQQTLECWDMACLDDLVALLEEIRDKECCADTTDLIDPVPIDGGGQIWIIDVGGDGVPVPDNDTSEGAGEYPITPATDPDEGGTVSHADWTAYLCGASNYVIDSLIDWLRFTRAAINLGWAATSIISWIGARIASALLPGVLDDFYVWESDTVAETLGDIVPALQSTQIDLAIENLDNARDALACALAGHSTATNAINALLALLSNYVTDAAVLGLLTSPVALLASLIWNGAIDTDWDTGCDCDVPLPEGYVFVPVVDFTLGSGYSPNGSKTDLGSGAWNLTTTTGLSGGCTHYAQSVAVLGAGGTGGIIAVEFVATAQTNIRWANAAGANPQAFGWLSPVFNTGDVVRIIPSAAWSPAHNAALIDWGNAADVLLEAGFWPTTSLRHCLTSNGQGSLDITPRYVKVAA